MIFPFHISFSMKRICEMEPHFASNGISLLPIRGLVMTEMLFKGCKTTSHPPSAAKVIPVLTKEIL